MAKEKWEVCGSDALVGATITYVEYDGSILAIKDGEEYRTEITRDWGYCYCEDGCTCYPTMVVMTERKIS